MGEEMGLLKMQNATVDLAIVFGAITFDFGNIGKGWCFPEIWTLKGGFTCKDTLL